MYNIAYKLFKLSKLSKLSKMKANSGITSISKYYKNSKGKKGLKRVCRYKNCRQKVYVEINGVVFYVYCYHHLCVVNNYYLTQDAIKERLANMMQNDANDANMIQVNDANDANQSI